MMPRPAQYLLRFDDLCPNLSRAGWERFKAIIDEFGIKPILAVIPDNRDSDLTFESSDPAFWEEMRTMEEAGATIALHGYQHLCDSPDPGLVPLHRKTEFAGVPESTQGEWLRAGLEILRDQKLTPKLFVAPRHGFDRATLRALKRAGIPYLSDGFARVPCMRSGVTWIPQQLWLPAEKSGGIWTICIHSNSAGSSVVRKLRSFLEQHVKQFTSFDRVVSEFPAGPLAPSERIYEAIAMWRTRLARQRRRRARAR
jgi:predicted deacetylase